TPPSTLLAPQGTRLMVDHTSRPGCPAPLPVRRPLVAALALLLTALPAAAAPGEAGKAVIGQPVSLIVQPDTIRLSGPRSGQQLLVTGRYRDGSERDLTPFCELSAEDAGVVSIAPGGFLQARKDGRTTLVVRAGPCVARVPAVVADCDKPQPVSFRRQF